MDSPEPIVAEVTVPTSARDAFLAFTAHMSEWWDPLLTPDPATFSGVEIDPEGEVAMRHGEQTFAWGEVTTWEPGERYAQSFWLGHSPDHPTTLSVTFQEDGGTTRVRLEHSGWTPETEDVRAKYGHWTDLMQRYAAHAAR